MNLPLTINKTVSRLIAIQAIYADDIRNQDRSCAELTKDMIFCYNEKSELLDEKINLKSPVITHDEKYLIKLLSKIFEYREEIDNIITNYLVAEWNIEKLTGVLKSILRAGVCEIKYFDNIPAKVSINEYTNLTREFYTNSEVGFVNGILDRISANI